MKNLEIKDLLAGLDRGESLGTETQRRLCNDLLRANRRLIEMRTQGEFSFGVRESTPVTNLAAQRAVRTGRH